MRLYSQLLLLVSAGCLGLPVGSVYADEGANVKIGTLSSTTPASWKVEKPANRLRSHQFKLESGDKDFADAEVSVSPEFNPDVDKSKPRWKSEYVPPDGKTIDDVTRESKIELKGALIKIVDINGTWKYKERPFDPKSKEMLRPEYRTIWALVIEKEDATLVKLSGPQKVVEKHSQQFETWLKALK